MDDVGALHQTLGHGCHGRRHSRLSVEDGTVDGKKAVGLVTASWGLLGVGTGPGAGAGHGARTGTGDGLGAGATTELACVSRARSGTVSLESSGAGILIKLAGAGADSAIDTGISNILGVAELDAGLQGHVLLLGLDLEGSEAGGGLEAAEVSVPVDAEGVRDGGGLDADSRVGERKVRVASRLGSRCWGCLRSCCSWGDTVLLVNIDVVHFPVGVGEGSRVAADVFRAG
jgi:hypothetical protein